ncbi:hypothetical protein COOONC_14622 [Cooperia oncophora]
MDQKLCVANTGTKWQSDGIFLHADGDTDVVLVTAARTPIWLEIPRSTTSCRGGAMHSHMPNCQPLIMMSAMSTIEDHRLQDLARFCRSFDTDGFVFCNNL